MKSKPLPSKELPEFFLKRSLHMNKQNIRNIKSWKNVILENIVNPIPSVTVVAFVYVMT